MEKFKKESLGNSNSLSGNAATPTNVEGLTTFFTKLQYDIAVRMTHIRGNIVIAEVLDLEDLSVLRTYPMHFVKTAITKENFRIISKKVVDFYLLDVEAEEHMGDMDPMEYYD